MNDLRITLIKLHGLLEELKPVLTEELGQLNRPQLNPVTLQMLSDNKSRLLSTINFFEEQRKAEETKLGIAAPYEQQPMLKTLWDDVVAIARETRTMNLSIYPILELQMQKALTLKSMVKQVSNCVALYGADGTSQQSIKGKAYNINI
ncbi:flagella synthesis protein FlgN [Pantoea sp. AS142]|uniref:flagella synthesis protein FlgN n=1 Tax=Pantoea sp. AS142 TaxID=3081292 RepID=UPI0030168494